MEYTKRMEEKEKKITWFQEWSEDWKLVPEPVMRGEIDVLGEHFIVGAWCNKVSIRRAHTIAIWWNQHALEKSVRSLLKERLGVYRPGSYSGSIVWSTDPYFTFKNSDITKMKTCDTADVMHFVHMIHHIFTMELTGKKVKLLNSLPEDIAEDAMVGKYLKSLDRAGIYEAYKDEI